MNGFLICVLGPPGAGKTTLSQTLATTQGGSRFRLREAIRYGQTEDSPITSDPLGWVGDDFVDAVLAREFAAGTLSSGPFPVFLDNFPGTAHQLRLLHAHVTRTSLQLSILELAVPDSVVADRIRGRRVCLRCAADPHAPCALAMSRPEQCAECGGPVVRRDTDSDQQHGLRVARFRANLHELAMAAGKLDIPYHHLDASPAAEWVRSTVSNMYPEFSAERIAVSPM